MKKFLLLGAAAVLFASMALDDASAQRGFGRGGGIGMARGFGGGIGRGFGGGIGMRGFGGGMGISRGIGVGRIGGAGFARPMAYGGRGFVGARYGALGGRGFVGPRYGALGGRGFVGPRYGAWGGRGFVGPRYAGWGRGYWPYRRYAWRRGWGWWGWPVAAGVAVAAATTYDDYCWRWDGWQWAKVEEEKMFDGIFVLAHQHRSQPARSHAR